MNKETIVILDFGSQYSQLIARRVRELKIYSKILPYYISAEDLKKENPKGIILSGGPSSVLTCESPKCDPEIFKIGIPVLGICYGEQLMVKTLGGLVSPCDAREYGRTDLFIHSKDNLFAGIPKEKITAWMSHGDKVEKLPKGFSIIANTDHTEFAAIANEKDRLFGIQFHPEVVHTEHGMKVIENFCRTICKITDQWTMASYVDIAVNEIRETVKDKTVILALSGGVDSSVAAALINKAIGHQLICIFVNNGLLRKNEAESVQNLYAKHFNINLKYVDAEDVFLQKLAGVSDPETKRKIIGHEFIEVFDKAALEI